ncbi:MAG: substrate-binding domain-containing protein [Planctomycetota bacterium]
MKTGNVGLLMIGTDAMFARAPVTAAVFHAAEQALTAAGFNLLIGQVDSSGRLPPKVASGQVDGLLLHGYAPPARIRESLKRHSCVWLMSARSSRGYWGDRVGPDHELIGRLAAEHLVARGHKNVAYLNPISEHVGFRSRTEAFVETSGEFGVAVRVYGPAPGSKTESPGKDYDDRTIALVKQVLQASPRPTGLFVPRDRVTVRVYRALRQLGVEPGRDIEIVSCDNEPVLEALDPRPTTIDVNPGAVGRRAVTQLLWVMGQEPEPTRSLISVEPRLVPGEPLQEEVR